MTARGPLPLPQRSPSHPCPIPHFKLILKVKMDTWPPALSILWTHTWGTREADTCPRSRRKDTPSGASAATGPWQVSGAGVHTLDPGPEHSHAGLP